MQKENVPGHGSTGSVGIQCWVDRSPTPRGLCFAKKNKKPSSKSYNYPHTQTLDFEVSRRLIHPNHLRNLGGRISFSCCFTKQNISPQCHYHKIKKQVLFVLVGFLFRPVPHTKYLKVGRLKTNKRGFVHMCNTVLYLIMWIALKNNPVNSFLPGA